MQYKIPQNLEIADKIVGPLTMRGLIIAGVGGGIAYFAYMKLDDDTWPFIVVPVVLLTLAIIFVKINDMNFLKWISSLLLLMLTPNRRVWMKLSDSPGEMLDTIKIQKKEENKIDDIEKTKKEKRKKLQALANQLKNNN